MKKLAILDRDGTIIWEPPRPSGFGHVETFPLKGPGQVAFMEGALEGMKKLQEKGYTLLMATNQSSLGTPKHPQEVFGAVMDHLKSELAKHGIRFEFIMVCPHSPDAGCDCRKPAIGGLKPFLKEHEGDIDFKNSLMFGDRDTDQSFAKNLGVRFVRVLTNGVFTLPSDI